MASKIDSQIRAIISQMQDNMALYISIHRESQDCEYERSIAREILFMRPTTFTDRMELRKMQERLASIEHRDPFLIFAKEMFVICINLLNAKDLIKKSI